MRKKTMTNGEISSLHQILGLLLGQSNIPLKFVISKNTKLLEEKVSAYESKRDEIFREAVKIDEKGNPCLLPEHKDQEGKHQVPYVCYEYNSPEAYEEMLNKLNSLAKETHDVELFTEKASRMIKVSVEKEGKIVYTETSIEEILEDPNNNIKSGVVMTLTEYMLD